MVPMSLKNEREGGKCAVVQRLHNTIFGGDLFLRGAVAALVMAAVVVVGLEDSNHIPVLRLLLQLKACMLNVPSKMSDKMEAKLRARIMSY